MGLRLGLFIALLLVTTSADANCARPVGYDATVEGSTVTVTPVSFGSRKCPDPDGMLRQNVNTGEVVRLADTCKDDAYVDECVPAGTFRYGFAKPYECFPSACSTDYFVEVQLVHKPGCASKAVAASTVPWGRSQKICSYGSRLVGCAAGVLLTLVVIAAVTITMIVRSRKKA
jgi:hypothetical protein